jgi:hypothetical protein
LADTSLNLGVLNVARLTPAQPMMLYLTCQVY